MKIERPLHIGITIGMLSANESLLINGIKQNALYLAKLFQNSRLRHKIVLLNTTDADISGTLLWDRTQFPTYNLSAWRQRLDVLIELGGQINEAQTAHFKSQGTKIVSYCCGPEYVQNMEAVIFRRRLWDSVFINQQYDEIWFIPQVAETTLHFLKTFRRRPAKVVPFVWDPMLVNAMTRDLPDHGEYRPRESAKRLTVIEPNIDVLKFCLYPILIAEEAFRSAPELILFLHVANAKHFVHDNTEFATLMHHLDIVRAHKASFIGRVDTPLFLADLTDVVISNQWGLPLNYFYLECCWQGYPFIHNAHLVADLGYYYDGNDVEAGARQLLTALREHDKGWERYRDAQRQRISRFLATDPRLTESYDVLLGELMSREG